MNTYMFFLIATSIFIGLTLIVISGYYKYILINSYVKQAFTSAAMHKLEREDWDSTKSDLNKEISDIVQNYVDNKHNSLFNVLVHKDVSLFFYENKSVIRGNYLISLLLNLIGSLIFFSTFRMPGMSYKLNGFVVAILGLYIALEVSTLRVRLNKKSVCKKFSTTIIRYSSFNNKNKAYLNLAFEDIVKCIFNTILSIIAFLIIGLFFNYCSKLSQIIPRIEIIILFIVIISATIYLLNIKIIKK